MIIICILHNFFKKCNDVFANFAERVEGYYPGGPNL